MHTQCKSPAIQSNAHQGPKVSTAHALRQAAICNRRVTVTGNLQAATRQRTSDTPSDATSKQRTPSTALRSTAHCKHKQRSTPQHAASIPALDRQGHPNPPEPLCAPPETLCFLLRMRHCTHTLHSQTQAHSVTPLPAHNEHPGSKLQALKATGRQHQSRALHALHAKGASTCTRSPSKTAKLCSVACCQRTIPLGCSKEQEVVMQNCLRCKTQQRGPSAKLLLTAAALQHLVPAAWAKPAPASAQPHASSAPFARQKQKLQALPACFPPHPP